MRRIANCGKTRTLLKWFFSKVCRTCTVMEGFPISRSREVAPCAAECCVVERPDPPVSALRSCIMNNFFRRGQVFHPAPLRATPESKTPWEREAREEAMAANDPRRGRAFLCDDMWQPRDSRTCTRVAALSPKLQHTSSKCWRHDSFIQALYDIILYHTILDYTILD